MIANSRILITGGTGTLGQELSKQLLAYNSKEIIIYSRNEVSQVEMRRSFPELTYVIGDIRDRKALRKALKNIDIVFHLAAIKHVRICEDQPIEAVKTNILGTQNIIDNFNGRLVFMSTDKAVNPMSIYGYTKAISEKNVLNFGGVNIRSGNIFGSSGSVVPFFINQVKTKNILTLTNPEMTRYFIKVNDLALFMLNAVFNKSGTYFPQDMRSYKMVDLAKVIVRLYGNAETKIIEVGAGNGEKLHESLDGICYSNESLSDAEELFEK